MGRLFHKAQGEKTVSVCSRRKTESAFNDPYAFEMIIHHPSSALHDWFGRRFICQKQTYRRMRSVLNIEIQKQAGEGFFLNKDFFDVRAGRSLVAPRQHFVHAIVLTFKDGFHASVGQVAYPAGEPHPPRRFPGNRPKKNSLNSSSDINMQTLQCYLPIIFKNSFSLMI